MNQQATLQRVIRRRRGGEVEVDAVISNQMRRWRNPNGGQATGTPLLRDPTEAKPQADIPTRIKDPCADVPLDYHPPTAKNGPLHFSRLSAIIIDKEWNLGEPPYYTQYLSSLNVQWNGKFANQIFPHAKFKFLLTKSLF